MRRRLRVLVPALLALAVGCADPAGAATGGVSADDIAAAAKPQAAGGTQYGAKLRKARLTRPRVTILRVRTPIEAGGAAPRRIPRRDQGRVPPRPGPVPVRS